MFRLYPNGSLKSIQRAFEDYVTGLHFFRYVIFEHSLIVVQKAQRVPKKELKKAKTLKRGRILKKFYSLLDICHGQLKPLNKTELLCRKQAENSLFLRDIASRFI